MNTELKTVEDLFELELTAGLPDWFIEVRTTAGSSDEEWKAKR